METSVRTPGCERAEVRPRGYRAEPTPRERERLAILAARERFAAGAEKFRIQLERGALVMRPLGDGWRFALFNARNVRTVVGTTGRYGLDHGFARTVAEALLRAPAEGGTSALSPGAVAEQMRMRRDSRTPSVRRDGSLSMRVPGAEIVITSGSLFAVSKTTALRLALEARWTNASAARVADAMLRDLAPEARHLTRTTVPRGHFRNESGSTLYDGGSTALCSCGWFCVEGSRTAARWTAKWHREHPGLYSALP